MSRRDCRAPGCGARTTRYGVYCTTHKSRYRRHGHPEQRAITKADLNPYLKRVRKRIKKNSDNPLWAHCEDLWNELVSHAKGIVTTYRGGQPTYRHERIAADEVVKLFAHVESREVIETVFAMFLLEDHQPRRFRSDGAFRFQLVRRLRGLTETNAGTWVDPSTGRTKRAYHELSPRAAEVFARWVMKALGGVGAYLAKLERDEEDERQRRVNDMHEAMSALV
ncbi:hypothetical protein M446_6406 [Methylobacterium sp. 4-46]|uniref:hypothetical protein n=1 Tax=unclassified Methylobacterium TaxID=2615210 RepID=UPI000152BF06|nr:MULTISPECIES: hypothetical protein [Methylobacterium]ACA20669.1 hypothetical protein M446_6406 [Methylobacterium sp. 4-46]WFT79828.1 hypothetical protein QA634_32370 [Methylobacterium nodulans]